jgi:integrase
MLLSGKKRRKKRFSTANRRSVRVTKGNTRKYLSEAEFKKLLSYVKGRGDLARRKGASRAVVDELIILLLARAGLRPNEVCALKIEDLPLRNGEETLWIRNQTGDILRKVEIATDISEYLARFVRFYRNGAKQTDYLLVSERGNPFGYMNIYSKLRKMVEQSGIGKLSPVTLRHTFIVRLFETEQDLRYVQEQAGYNSLRTVAMYVAGNNQMKATVRNGAGLMKQTKIRHKRKESRSKKICEACGTKIAGSSGKRIESGQFLCNECLSYF